MSEPSQPYKNITGLTLYIDTHILDSLEPAAVSLKRLREEGWINLQRTDVMDTELAAAPPEKWAQLTERSAAYPEALGPAVVGHSRVESAVVGSEEDGVRLDETFAILFPGADRQTARQNHIRDAMHVSTAIRYGGFGFVTNEKRLLNKADRIAERFQGFKVLTPEAALAEAAARVKSARALHRLEPHRGTLPTWPEEDPPSD
jgi:hypothetical protein